MGNACVSQVVDCLVFTPPHPCSYDQEMKESKKKGQLPEGIVFITTKHGSRIPLHIVKHKRARCTVLYSHGNSEDLGPMISNQYLSEWFRGNYISYDYTGYGYSEGGEHTEEHVYNDIEAVYEYLTTDGGIKPEELILYGRSLGSGPTVHLASTKPNGIAGMVLESALLSIVRTQCRCVSESWKSDIFCNIDKISKIEAPTLIIHGTRDCVVPHYHGRHLQDNIKNTVEPLWLPRGHNDLWDGDEAHCRPIFDKINKFISHALRERRRSLLYKTVHPSRTKRIPMSQHDKKNNTSSNRQKVILSHSFHHSCAHIHVHTCEYARAR
uniref:Serine aminopeptidase S33 domain-containing protein n=1 Tax=Lotharella globosa TaxID=91324 RepID=A0A7S3Z069_9EUKA